MFWRQTDREHDFELVGNGGAPADHEIVIVDPKQQTPCENDTIGEIWIAGPSVAQGYWNRPDETEETFRARFADTGRGPFLRTGDLGFIHTGQLFVTGRLKDLIIIRGLNHYPQDIERTAERSHEALRAGCGAAFAVEVENEERLVVVQEIERSYIRKLDAETVIGAIRQSITREHGLQAYAVVLLKTSSSSQNDQWQGQTPAVPGVFHPGQFGCCCRVRGILRKKLSLRSPFQAWEKADNLETENAAEHIHATQSSIAKMVSVLLKISFSKVDVHDPLNTMGIDSLMAVELKTAIEEDLGFEIPVEALFMGASIADLAAHVLWLGTSGGGLGAKDGPLAKVLSSGRQSGEPVERICAHKKARDVQPECLPFVDFPEYRNLQQILLGMKARGIDNPYFREHEGDNSRGTDCSRSRAHHLLQVQLPGDVRRSGRLASGQRSHRPLRHLGFGKPYCFRPTTTAS